ncbi:FAD-dependent oxidoreductase [Streptomyces mutabilis]|uniref:FAD-dependent oxidoreductase n=1 Tax=Streptomyces mutabilis TaxID=67332 RepID=UPI00364EFE62
MVRQPAAVVVGAGPSGFYTAAQLLDAGFTVDMVDTLPTPFGLVRAGVAPDHPNIKVVTRVFDKVAARDGFRFFGGLTLGENLSRKDLVEHYDATVYATGMPESSRLAVPGEDRLGSVSATRLVAWYNGHPDAAEAAYDLSARRAVVIGNGNVAMDVARILALDVDALRRTDMADHAIAALDRSRLEEIVVLGRRGPVQAAFTSPELGEIAKLTEVDAHVDPRDLDLDEHSASALASADPTTRMNVDLLRELAAREARPSRRRISFRFLWSPLEIVGDGPDGAVTGLRIGRNRIERGPDGSLRAVATGEEQVIDCGMVIRAIGYRGRPIDGLPFDDRTGRIPNVDGRLVEDGEVQPGEYVVGWIKRGPSGVIGTNKKCAVETAAAIRADRDGGRLNPHAAYAPDTSAAMLLSRARSVVDWQGWQAIDRAETEAGQEQGRPRVKLVRRSDLLAAATTEPAL